MPTMGRFGITRDQEGRLANITDWPWYWRYPLAIVGVAASVLLGAWSIHLHPDKWWVGLLIAGVGAFLSLCMVPGFLILAIGVGIFLGITWLAKTALYAFFPSLASSNPAHLTWQETALVWATIYLFFENRSLKHRVDRAERQIQAAWDCINKTKGWTSS